MEYLTPEIIKRTTTLGCIITGDCIHKCTKSWKQQEKGMKYKKKKMVDYIKSNLISVLLVYMCLCAESYLIDIANLSNHKSLKTFDFKRLQ